MTEKSVCITGTPCSATHYIREVMRFCGIKLGAERGMKHWPQGFVSWSGILQPEDAVDVWLHQVRNPIKTISSLQVMGIQFFEELIANWDLPVVSPQENMIGCCAEFWMEWNQRCEDRCEYTYRIEDIDKELYVLVERINGWLGYGESRQLLRKMREGDVKTINSKRVDFDGVRFKVEGCDIELAMFDAAMEVAAQRIQVPEVPRDHNSKRTRYVMLRRDEIEHVLGNGAERFQEQCRRYGYDYSTL